MTAEQHTGPGLSLSYGAYCERLNGVPDAELMYAHDESSRTSLEILWLKLSLLAQIAALSNSSSNLNNCTVTLNLATPQLPVLWNFQCHCPPAAQPAYDAAELGRFWLRTLVVNKEQADEHVDAETRELIAAHADAAQLQKAVMNSSAFSANQLTSVGARDNRAIVPHPLWWDVLSVGFKLATKIPGFSYMGDAPDFNAEVRARIIADSTALQQRARQALFVDPPRMDQDLRQLVLELVGDAGWLDAYSVPKQTPRTAPQTPQVQALAPMAVPVVEEENAEATIIVKRGTHVPAAPAQARIPPSPPSNVGSMDETVIIGKSGTTPNGTRPVPPPPEEAENLEATIIVPKDKKR